MSQSAHSIHHTSQASSSRAASIFSDSRDILGAAPRRRSGSSPAWILPTRGRFPQKISEKAEERQLDEREKVLNRIRLEQFSPKTEEQLEDWIDVAASQITRQNVCLILFQEAWMAAATPAYARRIGNIVDAENHEDLVSKVAMTLFPVSKYVQEVEDKLRQGSRQATVLEADHYCQDLLYRYIRLSQRRDWEISVTRARYIEALLCSFPIVVEMEVRKVLRGKVAMIAETVELAYHFEAEMNRYPGLQPTIAMPISTNPLFADEHTQQSGPQREGRDNSQSRLVVCFCCGERGHYKSKCPHKDVRCSACQVIGHMAKVCRRYVKKDAVGRLTTRVTDAPKGLTIETRGDRSTEDKVDTAANVLKLLKDVAQKKSRKNREKREQKKSDRGWVRKRKVIEHPAGRVEEESSSDEDSASSESEDDDGTYKKVHKMFEDAKMLCIKTDEEVAPVVWCEIVVNNREFQCVADTGSGRSICSPQIAQQMGLTFTESQRCFKGLGRALGRVAEPVAVKLKGCSQQAEVTFNEVPQEDFQTVIGVRDLQKFNVYIDPVSLKVISRQGNQEACTEIVSTVAPQQKSVVSGVAEGLTDEELLAEGRKLVFSQMECLEECRRQEVWAILEKHRKCWLRPRSGQFEGFKASFKVRGPPFRDKLRPLIPSMKEELDRQVNDMLKHKILRTSQSPWGASPVFVQKKNGNWRMALNYVRLNRQMKPDAYPLPRLWDLVQEAAHHVYYTVLDCQWGFWNVALEEESKECTAILTYRGSFEFNVLPFGIRNSPAIYQRAMDYVFSSLRSKGVWWYVDDIVIFSNAWEEHLELLTEVLRLCVDKGIFINLKKAMFARSRVEILGHYVSVSGIQPSVQKVEALQRSVPPKGKKELHSFLGLAAYVSKFIPHFATITSPLFELMKKNVEFRWNKERQEAFELLKASICEKVMLTAPQGSGPFVVVCDASGVGIGAAILQVQGNALAILEFGSKRLTPAERRWDTREREAFAIKWAVQRFVNYIRGSEVYVITDHESLRWIEKAKEGKVQRWALFLQQYDITLLHIDGEFNAVADWLSRSLEDDEDRDDIIEQVATPVLAVEEASEAESSAGALSSQVKTHGSEIVYVPTTDDFKKCYDTITTQEKREIYRAPDGMYYSVRTHRLFVPAPLRDVILYWFHLGKYGGHVGVNKTVCRMQRWVWWPRLSQSVQEYVKNCLICIRLAVPQPQRLLAAVLTKPLPLQTISMDFIGPIKWSGKSLFCCVIIDHATRFMVATVCEHSGSSAIKVLRDHWCHVFQAPNVVLTDRGSEFLSEFNKFVTEELLSYHVYTSPYYPQGNAINEAAHKAFNKSVAAQQLVGVPSLESAVATSVAVHNSCPHSALGVSPYFSLFGFEPALPGWQKYRNQHEGQLRIVQRNELRQQQVLKAQLDRDEYKLARDVKLQVGDWVVYFLSKYERSVLAQDDNSFKYSPSWSLPAKVVEIKSTCVMVQNWCSTSLPRQVPLTQVRKLEGNLPPSLREITLKQLQREHPRAVRPRFVNQPKTGASESWDTLLESAAQLERKRPRQE